jgi:hypothetical protein
MECLSDCRRRKPSGLCGTQQSTVRLARPPYHLIRASIRRVLRPHKPSHLSLAQVADGRTWACTDLGAFPRPVPPLAGLEGVVIMEDRDPRFFLSFTEYAGGRPTELNRHGPLQAWATYEDLRALVAQLHAQRIKVAVGFWNYSGWLLHRKIPWVREHPELRHLPLTTQLYPFVRLHREGISYAAYIGAQYERLRDAFDFDGLMLGDGFCGFTSIWDPDRYRDQAGTIPAWTEFYRTLAGAVHKAGGILLAYDAMGWSAATAADHGVDYGALGSAGLDVLVYQSYPQAWAGFWLESYSSRFDLAANLHNVATVTAALRGTGTRVLYTLELGDSVERWWAEPDRTLQQMAALDPLCGGRFLVWANDVVARLSPAGAYAGAGTVLGASRDVVRPVTGASSDGE